MKTLHSKIGLLVLVSFLSMPAFAKEASKTRKVVEPDTRDVSATSTGGGSSARLGLGFSTYGASLIGGLGTFAPALSGWVEFTPKHSVQILFGVLSSSPFQFGVGGVYHYTALGTPEVGLHLGIGFNLGTVGTGVAAVIPGASTTSFFLNIFPVGGFHFTFLRNMQLCFDGGPLFAVTPNFQFSMGPNSALLGASFHYFLD